MNFLLEFIQYTVSGLTSGSIYAIVGVCWSIVFLVTGIANFSTGEFVMLGGMFVWFLVGLGIGLPLSAILAITLVVIIGIALQRIALQPVKKPSHSIYIVITIAAASIIKGIILLTLGSETRRLEPFINSGQINILGISIDPQAIIVIGTLVIIGVGLSLFFNYTLFGKALRATAINSNAARLVGLRVDRLRVFSFGLAGGLGAIAGIVTAPITFMGYGEGALTGMKGLVAAIVGSWSIPGSILAGLGLGVVEGLFAGFISSGWRDALAFFVMIVYLVVRTISFSPRERKL